MYLRKSLFLSEVKHDLVVIGNEVVFDRDLSGYVDKLLVGDVVDKCSRVDLIGVE